MSDIIFNDGLVNSNSTTALFSEISSYDYNESTTDNHCWDEISTEQPLFVGKYAEARKCMDYSYHKHYSPERQQLHDEIIDDCLYSNGTDFDLEENWLVFTAGTMVSNFSC